MEWLNAGSRYAQDLTTGLNRDAFLDVWEEPDRTHTVSSDEFLSAGWEVPMDQFLRARDSTWVLLRANSCVKVAGNFMDICHLLKRRFGL